MARRRVITCCWRLAAFSPRSFLCCRGLLSELRAVLKTVPLDRLLVETDAPYLAPMPYRGKRNEPSFVVNTAAMLAELKGVSADELARATTDNFFRLFTKAKRPA